MKIKSVLFRISQICIIFLIIAGCTVNYGLIKESLEKNNSLGVVYKPRSIINNLSSLEGTDKSLVPVGFSEYFGRELQKKAYSVLTEYISEDKVFLIEPNPYIPQNTNGDSSDGELILTKISTNHFLAVSYFGILKERKHMVINGSLDNRSWKSYYCLEFHSTFYIGDPETGKTIGGLRGYYQSRPIRSAYAEKIENLDPDEMLPEVIVYLETELHKFLKGIQKSK